MISSSRDAQKLYRSSVWWYLKILYVSDFFWLLNPLATHCFWLYHILSHFFLTSYFNMFRIISSFIVSLWYHESFWIISISVLSGVHWACAWPTSRNRWHRARLGAKNWHSTAGLRHEALAAAADADLPAEELPAVTSKPWEAKNEKVAVTWEEVFKGNSEKFRKTCHSQESIEHLSFFVSLQHRILARQGPCDEAL